MDDTAKEAIVYGKLVLISADKLINHPDSQQYALVQSYSLIMQEINRRIPDNPKDKPVTLVMDELYPVLRVTGMAPEIASLSPQYRSRKLQLHIVLQELAQMSKDLRPHIWSLGNIVSFGISNHDEAYEMAQQLFNYDPYAIKVGATREGQHPLMEQDRGQYLLWADFIQSLQHRACLIRRFKNEREREKKIQYVPLTYEFPHEPLHISVQEAKDYLLRQRGVQTRAALGVVNKRELNTPKQKPPSI